MSFIGAILGDIAGSQYEFDRTDKPLTCPLYNEKSCFTDDTVMTLAIKYALDTKTDLTLAMREVGRHYPMCGYGGRFFTWMYSGDPKPYGSFGNGSGMRVSYVADYYDDLEDIKKHAEETALVTHNHPEGIKGAVATATCIWMAKNGKSKEDIYNYIISEYPPEKYSFSIDKDMDYLKKNYAWDVTCMTSIPVAMRCFIESDSYESFLRTVLSIECDCDTLCAIGGSVAEEFYSGTGFDNDKLLKQYLDDYLYNIYKGNYESIQK